MASYLTQEGGGKILLEDHSGAIVLELSVAGGPTVFYQAGGAGHPAGHRKKKHDTQELFDRIERTLQEAVGLVPPRVADAPEPAAAHAEEGPVWSAERLETALASLAEMAAGSARLEARLATLRQALDDEARLRDDEESWMLLM